MLSDRSIKSALSGGLFSISPVVEENIQPNSIDMRLSHQFRVFENHKYQAIDVVNVPDDLTKLVEIKDGDTFILHPGEMVLASTIETVDLGNKVTGLFVGRSSMARCGLVTESAGLVDSGFSGQITLELANISNLPLILTPGIKIGQLCLFKLDSPAVNLYGSKGLGSHYQNQQGPTPSRLFREESSRLTGE